MQHQARNTTLMILIKKEILFQNISRSRRNNYRNSKKNTYDDVGNIKIRERFLNNKLIDKTIYINTYY
jgi:hypothetical protein